MKKTQNKRQLHVSKPVQAMPSITFMKHYKTASVVLLLLSFLLYGASIRFGYVLDDEIVISGNAFVQKGISGIRDILAHDTFTGALGKQDLVAGSRYRPLSLITFAIEYQLMKLNPQASHFINVLLYGITGVILLYVITLLFPAAAQKPWFAGVPFAAALLFIAHPLHTEVVANIKSRDEILSLLFALLTLIVSLRFISNGKKYLLLLAAICFFLALLAKENAVTFVAVIPLAVYFFRNEPAKKTALTFIPLAVAATAYIVLRYHVIGYFLDSGKPVTGLMNNPFLEAAPGQKYATIFYTLGLYVKLLFFPHPLTHDYYPYHIPLINWLDARALVPLALYILLLAYSIYAFREKTVAAFCILFFLITLSISSNLLFPIGTFMNERFLYMPSIGFCILLSFLLLEQLPQSKVFSKAPRFAGLVIIVCVALAFSAKTVARVPAWKDNLALDRAAVKVSKNSARANSFMGYGLYREALEEKNPEQQKKLFDEATFYVDRALAIHPAYPDALTAKAGILGGYYQLDRDLDKLLDGFYRTQTTYPIPFVDEYLNYLEQVEDRARLAAFMQKLGVALKQKGLTQKGDYYLRKAAAL